MAIMEMLQMRQGLSGVFQCRWTHPLQGHGVLLPHSLLHDRVLWRERKDYWGQFNFAGQINNVLCDVTATQFISLCCLNTARSSQINNVRFLLVLLTSYTQKLQAQVDIRLSAKLERVIFLL